MRYDHDQPANIPRILANLPTGPAPGTHHGCCGDPPSRGRLCPYHQGYEDGWEAATKHPPTGPAPGAQRMDAISEELLATTDAAVWARQFIRLVQSGLDPTDFGWVVGWFANAIETGRTASHQQSLEPNQQEVPTKP